jgi:hypothetical protein
VGQALHDAAAAAAPYLPGGQAMHESDVEPAVAMNLPAGQMPAQEVCPVLPVYWPVGQLLHTDVVPVLLDAGCESIVSPCPATLMNLPAGQPEQADLS